MKTLSGLLLSFFLFSACLFAGNTDLVMTGEGAATGREEAIQNALRNAIEKDLGVFISAKTLVGKGQVLSENILSYSKGYIESYDIVSETTEAGLIKIKVVANIDQDQLATKLNGIGFVDISGESYVYNAMLEIEREKNAKLIITDAYDDTMKGGLDFEMGKPVFTVNENDKNNMGLKFNIRCIPDRTAWERFFKIIRKFESVPGTRDSHLFRPDTTLLNLPQGSAVGLTQQYLDTLFSAAESTSLYLEFFDDSAKMIHYKCIGCPFRVKFDHTDNAHTLTPNGKPFSGKQDDSASPGFELSFEIREPMGLISRTKKIKAVIKRFGNLDLDIAELDPETKKSLKLDCGLIINDWNDSIRIMQGLSNWHLGRQNILLEIDGNKMKDTSDFREYVLDRKTNDNVKLTVLDTSDDSKHVLTVTLNHKNNLAQADLLSPISEIIAITYKDVSKERSSSSGHHKPAPVK